MLRGEEGQYGLKIESLANKLTNRYKKNDRCGAQGTHFDTIKVWNHFEIFFETSVTQIVIYLLFAGDHSL